MIVQEFNQPSTQQEQVSYGAFQHNVSNIMPTSPEIGYLWWSMELQTRIVLGLI
ncbi:hypothetical protein [Desulfosporosinus sp. FKB]|uniref:hypothetical protein n=1 Tax=Desulfosporosinus sp. FKB TaxID=1969835 RepID=UPI00148234E9|nr:hypothetical protein [Desulfosporosinus sp. FKB]